MKEKIKFTLIASKKCNRALKIMKISTLLFFFGLFTLTAENVYSQQAELSLELRNVTIKEAISEIEKSTDYVFLITDEARLELNKRTSVSVNKESIHAILKALLKNTDLKYTVVERQVSMYKDALTRKVKAPVAGKEEIEQQKKTITGRITDESGEAIIGANIVEVNENVNGTVSDIDGNFSLIIEENAVIQVSYIGYLTQEINTAGQTTINIILQEDTQALDEVVVVGFGTQRKIQTLGAQAGVRVTELKQPVANISTVLSGRISGLIGMQRGGEPGLDGSDLWIRGFNTLNNSSPLILVDGIERSFSNIDPNDIESFNILKDASATSVYGVRGANGVILITTKRGRAMDKPEISFDYFRGLTQFTRTPQMADGVTYMQMANEANVTRGNSPIYSEEAIRMTATQEDPYLYPNVNWMDEIFNKFGSNTKANLNIRGGGEKMNYYVSVGYYDEKGLFKTDGLQQYNSQISFERYNFTSALTLHATETTQLDLGIKGWISNGNYPGTGTNQIFQSVFNVYPILYPVQYPNGTEPFVSTGGGLSNPYGLLTNRGYTTTYANQILSDIHLKQKLDFVTKGLSARVLYSFDAENTNRLNRSKTPYTYYAIGRDEEGELIYEPTDQGQGRDYLSFSRENGGSRQFYLEAALNYDRRFGDHIINGIFLYNQSDRISATANSLVSSIPYRHRGIVGRGSYSYDDRYLAEISFGYNGAENFAPSHRYGLFPSFAVGWVPSNERFWGNLSDVIQLLKLRASYGLTGSGDIGGLRFAYISTVTSVNGYNYGQYRDRHINGVDIGEYASNVGWETEKYTNLGVEITTLDNSLDFMVDVFNRRRENIFLRRASVPESMGLRSNPYGNLGITESKGIDLSADYRKSWGDFGLTFKGTFTFNQNTLIENDEPTQPYPWLERRGHRLYQRFGYIADGFYTQEEIEDPSIAKTAGVVQAGDLKFRDLNGDGVIDGNDQTAIGLDQVPQILYGFGFTAAYKGFSLGAFFQGTERVEFSLARTFMPFREGSTRGSLYHNIWDRWTEDNQRQDAFYPRLSYGDINQNYSAQSSHWVMDGSFLRLKTLDFGYTFPRETFQRIGVNNLRLYFIGYNLLTFSSFKMFDPELGNGAGDRYPNIKTYSLGIDLTF